MYLWKEEISKGCKILGEVGVGSVDVRVVCLCCCAPICFSQVFEFKSGLRYMASSQVTLAYYPLVQCCIEISCPIEDICWVRLKGLLADQLISRKFSFVWPREVVSVLCRPRVPNFGI